MVACLSVFYKGSDAKLLAEFGPETEKDIFEDVVEELLNVSDLDRTSEIEERIKGLVSSEEFYGLAEIHPAWLVDILSKETPRVIGIIMRYLPSNHVRYILSHLPRRITSAMPQIVDAFSVPTPILTVIRGIFERHFIPMHTSKNIKEFSFQNLYYLKAEELETLIKDLGIQELAMAIEGVEPRTLNVLLNRLTMKEATALKSRITALKSVDAALTKEAKYTILEMSLEEMDAPVLITEIGLNALAKAFSEDDLEILPLLRQKLSPRLGYILKRYIDLHRANPSSTSVLRQTVVLARLSALSQNGAIDEQWGRFFVSQDETSAFQVDEEEADVISWQAN